MPCLTQYTIKGNQGIKMRYILLSLLFSILLLTLPTNALGTLSELSNANLDPVHHSQPQVSSPHPRVQQLQEQYQRLWSLLSLIDDPSLTPAQQRPLFRLRFFGIQLKKHLLQLGTSPDQSASLSKNAPLDDSETAILNLSSTRSDTSGPALHGAVSRYIHARSAVFNQKDP